MSFARLLRTCAFLTRFGFAGGAATIAAEVTARSFASPLPFALAGATAGVLVWRLTAFIRPPQHDEI